MNKILGKICLAGALSTVLLVSAAPVPALALTMPSLIVCDPGATTADGKPDKSKDCTFQSLYKLGQAIITLIFYLSVPAATVLFSYAGYLYMTSAGDTGKVEEAHKIFKNVAIGFIIICAAWLIVSTILSSLLTKSNFDIINNVAQ